MDGRVARLRACLDRYAGRYRELRAAASFEEYVARKGDGADEETLTEPLLADLVEQVLGFPRDAYSPSSAGAGSSRTSRRST